MTSLVILSWDHLLLGILHLILVGIEFLWCGNPLSKVSWDILVGEAIDWLFLGVSFLVVEALIIRGGDAVVGIGLVSDFEEFFLLAVDKIVLLHFLKFDLKVVLSNTLELSETFVVNLVLLLSGLDVLHLNFDLVKSILVTFLYDGFKSILQIGDLGDFGLWE